MTRVLDARVGPRPFLGGWHLLVPLVAMAAVRDLWAPDEPRYAQIAREAWESGNFLVLHLCGDLYPDKPPLVYWLAAVCGRLGGWSGLALRLPLILATWGSALIAVRIARRHLGEVAAAWTPVFYLGTAMVAWFGGRLQLDPLLAFFCLAAIDLAWTDGGTSAQRARRLLLAGVCVGVAALCKGPVAWLHVGLALAALRCVPGAARVPARFGAGAWVGFVVLAMLPVAIWAVAAALQDPALWRPLLVGEHLGRAADARAPHSGPPWEHLWQVPLLVLPWTPLFLAGIAAAWGAWTAARRGQATQPGLVRMAVWFAAVLVVFSVMPPKRELYLLPIYPACAWFTAVAFQRVLGGGARRAVPRGATRSASPYDWLSTGSRWSTWATSGLFLLAGIGIAAAPLLDPKVGEHVPLTWPVALPMIAGALASFVFLRRGRPGRWADAIAVGFSAAALAAVIWVLPAVDPLKSARGMAQVVAARPEKPERIPCVGVQPEGYRFYGGVPTVRSHPGVFALEMPDPDFLALVSQSEWQAVQESARARYVILASRSVGSRAVLLVGAAPRSGT